MLFDKYYTLITSILAIWGLVLTLVLIVNSFVKRALINIDKLVQPLGSEKLQALLDQIRKNKIELRKPSKLRDFMTRVAELAFFIIFAPNILLMVLLLGLLIKLDTRGPVFYTQKRVGINGKIFNYLRFRTVYVANQQEDLTLLAHNDIRLTRMGQFLRKTNLDVLPAFINLLRGDIAIVGRSLDRPESEKDLPLDIKENLMSIKPGIISLWAISYNRDRVKPTLDSLLLCDLVYLSKMSIWLDFVITLRAIVIILGTSAAY